MIGKFTLKILPPRSCAILQLQLFWQPVEMLPADPEESEATTPGRGCWIKKMNSRGSIWPGSSGKPSWLGLGPAVKFPKS